MHDLAEAFKQLEKYQVKLNPKKCMLEVESGKFMGHIVNKRGLEAEPKQIQALIDMKAPPNIRDVQA